MSVSVEEDTCIGTFFTTCGGGYVFVPVEEDTCLFPWMRILALVLALLLVEEDTCLRLRISAVNIRRLIIFSSLH